jgi:hypothetical protein
MGIKVGISWEQRNKYREVHVVALLRRGYESGSKLSDIISLSHNSRFRRSLLNPFELPEDYAG